MAQRAAIFCHNGLGDAVISLVLSHNFHQNGWKVDTYHNGMDALQAWFPHLPILSYPKIEKISETLDKYDNLIIFHNDTHDFIQKLIESGKKTFPEKVFVIYPYPTKGIMLRKYYEDSLFDPTKPIVENLTSFCKDILHFTKSTKKNGLIAPRNLVFRSHSKRVVLHVSSSRPGKNWPIQKFLELAILLKKDQYHPIIIAGGKKERKEYEYLEKEGWILPEFESLHDVTKYLYESAYLIGNDSGLGHLASSMGIPTLTISRRKNVARFWKPSFAPNELVFPNSLIPNISGFRLRDRKWQSFISVSKVYRKFQKLLKKTKEL